MSTKASDTLLYREIHEQPEALSRFLQEEADKVKALAQAIKRQDIHQVVIAARGTSDNAGRYAKYVLGARNQQQVALAAPSLYTHYNSPPRLRNSLVLAISQSGRSPDIVAVLVEAKRQGQLTAAITNEPDSPLAAAADHLICLQAGPEKAVAATKTFSNSLLAIASLSNALLDREMTALAAIPEAVSRTLELAPTIAQLAHRYRYMQHCVVIGRGFNYATAFEVALKLKELTYTIVEPYSSADFLHGPLALLDHGFPIILLAPTGALSTEMVSFLDKIRGRKAEVLGISDDPTILAAANLALKLPATVAEWLSPLTAVISGQLLALNIAHIRGYNVDQPRAISKVTETR